MRKKLISTLLVGTMTLSLAACGGSSSSNSGNGGGSSSGGGSSAPSGNENTLTVYAWDPAFNIPALKAAEEAYKAGVNPDFVLDIREQSGSSDIETAITTAASAGKYDTLPDIVLFQDHWIQQYVKDYPDAWQNVNDADVKWDDFSAEKLDYSTIDGVHYGVPVDGGTVVTAYRVDLLEEAGYTIDDLTGISWAEFIEIGKAVKEKTGKYLMCMDGDGNDLVYLMLQAEGVSQFKDGKPYITENETLKQVIQTIVDMSKAGVLLLTNSWSDYTDKAIQGDQVAGVMNGNWIIPTIEKVEANNGKWEITSMPTLEGGKEGYASNGGSSLYITANCKNTDLAKDFLAYTFGGGEGAIETYDNALKNGGLVSTYAPAGESEVYNEGVAFFNDTPIYADIVEMGTHVQIVEQSPYHYTCRTQLAAAIVNVINGSDLETELKNAEDQLNFEMGN
ncbi:MAG: sugar ABC transporter substrate-binding protein [Lachnospiraceae bacterium]|nr:sugar ABC transporter substrate-binding protein [Lachnospiraceae bacterium]